MFDSIGPVGDRSYCLVDMRTRSVLKTITAPTLIGVVARFADSVLELSLPDGRNLQAETGVTGETVCCSYWGRPVELTLVDGPHSGFLSSWIGHDVRLAAAPRGGVVYGAPYSLVTSASLKDLGSRAGHALLDDESSRFRSTFVVRTERAYIEDTWKGRVILVAGRELRVGEPIPRCGVIDLDPRTGKHNTSLLRALAGYRQRNRAGEPCFGVYAYDATTAETD